MPRPIWKGHITFGLVNIPVTLYSAEIRSDLHFKLIDGRNQGAIRYEKVNEITGEEVPWNEIVKVYEHDKGEFVVLTDEDFKNAAPKATESVEIEDFVDQEEIPPEYFDKPYHLVPTKAGKKSYALLRETMRKSGRVGIARVVIRTREYIAALMVREQGLMLNLLRYQQELREIPSSEMPDMEISDREISMAEQLVESMTGKWIPEKYEDEYRKALMSYIDEKVSRGNTTHVSTDEADDETETPSNVIDIVDLLKRSMAKREAEKPTPENSTKAPPKKSKRTANAKKP